jgi:hypothetical protein
MLRCSHDGMRKQPTKPMRKEPAPTRGGSSDTGRESTGSSRTGLGPDSAGQSGDNQGLFSPAEADSESVEELLEEGQYLEAGIVSGVERASDAREVRTRQLPEDDVPLEYQNPESD